MNSLIDSATAKKDGAKAKIVVIDKELESKSTQLENLNKVLNGEDEAKKPAAKKAIETVKGEIDKADGNKSTHEKIISEADAELKKLLEDFKSLETDFDGIEEKFNESESDLKKSKDKLDQAREALNKF